MSDALRKIVARRRADVAEARRRADIKALEARAARRRRRSLADALRIDSGPARIIAEIKRASPSAGPIRPDLSPARMARAYADGGAAALSVLTEPHFFGGSEADLESARAHTDLPLLRKDFIVDEFQVLETAALGADILLLIVAALDAGRLRDLAGAAASFGLEILIEAHDESELDTALEYPEALIGVNSRNLKTLETDLAVARRLAGRIPAGRPAVAESGIRTAEDILDLRARGYRAFLIGESLLTGQDPGASLRALLQRSNMFGQA